MSRRRRNFPVSLFRSGGGPRRACAAGRGKAGQSARRSRAGRQGITTKFCAGQSARRSRARGAACPAKQPYSSGFCLAVLCAGGRENFAWSEREKLCGAAGGGSACRKTFSQGRFMKRMFLGRPCFPKMVFLRRRRFRELVPCFLTFFSQRSENFFSKIGNSLCGRAKKMLPM